MLIGGQGLKSQSQPYLKSLGIARPVFSMACYASVDSTGVRLIEVSVPFATTFQSLDGTITESFRGALTLG